MLCRTNQYRLTKHRLPGMLLHIKRQQGNGHPSGPSRNWGRVSVADLFRIWPVVGFRAQGQDCATRSALHLLLFLLFLLCSCPFSFDCRGFLLPKNTHAATPMKMTPIAGEYQPIFLIANTRYEAYLATANIQLRGLLGVAWRVSFDRCRRCRRWTRFARAKMTTSTMTK